MKGFRNPEELEEQVRVFGMIRFLIPVNRAGNPMSRDAKCTGSGILATAIISEVRGSSLLFTAVPIYLQQTSNSVNTCFPLATEHSIVSLTGASLLGKNTLLPRKHSLVFQFTTAAARNPGGNSEFLPLCHVPNK